MAKYIVKRVAMGIFSVFIVATLTFFIMNLVPGGPFVAEKSISKAAQQALAEKYGKTPAQVLLRFLTQKGIAVIPRSTQPEHIRENFALFDFKLTADELAQLSALDKKEPLIGKPETPELVEFSLTR